LVAIPSYDETNWGVNPAQPTLSELLWLSNKCAIAVKAGLAHDNSWDESDERLPFVYEHWIDMGAPTAAQLQKELDAVGPFLSSPSSPPNNSTPSHPLTLATHLPQNNTLPTQPSAPPAPNSLDAGGPSGPPLKGAPNPKGKEKVQPTDNGDDKGDGEEAVDAPTLWIHCHAPFTIEKQWKVLSMTCDFLENLHGFANKEHLDPTAVVRVFKKQLGAMKLSSWQAYERLASIGRGGRGSKCLRVVSLFTLLMKTLFLSR
jgi:hypothetical protein